MRYKFAFLITLLWSVLGAAHPLDIGFVQAKIEGREISASIDLHPRIVSNLLGVEETKLTPQLAADSAEKLMQLSLGGGKATLGGATAAGKNPAWSARTRRRFEFLEKRPAVRMPESCGGNFRFSGDRGFRVRFKFS